MKIFHSILISISTLLLMFILLITSIEIIAYHMPNYYKNEYEKYEVTKAVDISMENLILVTDDMMAYLRGNKENLSDIKTTINGIADTPFFNEREILHMEDVRNLFISAIFLRRISLAFIIISLIAVKFTGGKLIKIIPKIFLTVSITACIAVGIILGVIASNFSKYFVIFHEIFFNNDLWMLDPRTDNLINIVPEGFFFDTALNIGICFFILYSIFFFINAFLIFKEKSTKI